MLFASAPRKDSVQSSKEGLKATRAEFSPLNTSPLANSSSADVVTNDDRTKSPDITRVLSPMRPRRTPVLINAPDVRWRLAPHLRHIPSLDSVLSTSTTSASETSTVRPIPIEPHNVALPLSSASSLVTVMPEETDPLDIPLPPSPPPPQIDIRFNEAIERPKFGNGRYFHQPHLLSPVTEASSAPSIRSSITDLDIQDVATAERHLLSNVGRQNVQVVGASQISLASQQSRQSQFAERFSVDGVEHYAESPRSGGQNGTPAMRGANGLGDKDVGAGEEEVAAKERHKAKTIRGKIRKLKRSVKGLGNRVAECVARRFVTRVLARGGWA
ncbi:hypothetical protein BU25DRAFT_469787 [Macroventuria anomochaeta]|uniref:Uncharacterized protein n=1 Tax=Macroventuria anomochaeta TaxID=301207 RepID=A0ACB6RY32_9PLEO|nr:uncharacterized protein BU25DRAFT_469787 [Macroventuria anomochaeta]KAF2626776.1 hypothetical protein BU25DRAFT_469787 [Macroventuria anomochaeta]